MGKINTRWLDTGEGDEQVNARAFLATFIPSNYEPTEVNGEGVDKMSAHLKGIDSKIGAVGAGQSVSFSQVLFEGDDITVNFPIPSRFGLTTRIDVFENGVLKREGYDWEREVSQQSINLIDNFGDPKPLDGSSKLKVRKYSQGVTNIEQFFGGNGTIEEFILDDTFNDSSNLEVWFSGLPQREGEEWVRDTSSNKIKIIDGLPEIPRPLEVGTEMRVRIANIDSSSEFFQGGVETLTLASQFNSGDKIDVHFNGVLREEFTDWVRDSDNNQISIVEATTNDVRLHVKIYF